VQPVGVVDLVVGRECIDRGAGLIPRGDGRGRVRCGVAGEADGSQDEINRYRAGDRVPWRPGGGWC
jgi:hypothetical protein